jgi:hypothetical protein
MRGRRINCHGFPESLCGAGILMPITEPGSELRKNVRITPRL